MKYFHIALLFVLSSLFLAVYADTNGIWHEASDVRVGTFGSDEGDNITNYVFDNPVTFNNILTYNSEDIEARYLNTAGDTTTGVIDTQGGLVIETRTDDPASPETGRIWLRTDLS